MRAASRFGIKEFTLQAARHDTADPTERMIGYKTWPRLGFNGTLKPDMQRVVADAGLGRARTIRQLRRTAEGRAWWDQHGDLIGLRWQVRPGNQSRRALDGYLRGKGLGGL